MTLSDLQGQNPSPLRRLAQRFGMANPPRNFAEAIEAMKPLFNETQLELLRYLFMTPQEFVAEDNIFPAGEPAPLKDNAHKNVAAAQPAQPAPQPAPAPAAAAPVAPVAATPIAAGFKPDPSKDVRPANGARMGPGGVWTMPDNTPIRSTLPNAKAFTGVVQDDRGQKMWQGAPGTGPTQLEDMKKLGLKSEIVVDGRTIKLW